MGVLQIFIGVITVLIVLVIMMQTINVLNDVADDVLTSQGATPKYGRDVVTGDTVLVGPSSALAEGTSLLLYSIGLAIVIGFIVWVVRHGKGGVYEEYGGY